MTQPEKTAVQPAALQNILVNMVITASGDLLRKGLENEAWVIDRLTSLAESNDQLIPGLKAYVDLPWVDELQAKGIRFLAQQAVRRAYSYALAHNLIPDKVKTTPPAVEPTPEDDKVAAALGVDASKITPIKTLLSSPTGAPPSGPSTPPATLTPPTPDLTGQKTETPDDSEDAPDYEAIAAEYLKGGGWYEFPAEEEGGEPIKVQGKEAATELLKTRDDLVYDQEEPAEDTDPDSDDNAAN